MAVVSVVIVVTWLSGGPSLRAAPANLILSASTAEVAAMAATACDMAHHEAAMIRSRSRLIDLDPEGPAQDGFLGMQAVFGLVQHHRLRTVDHLVGHLVAAMGGQVSA